MPHADSVVSALGVLLGSIIHGVELSNFVRESDFLEQNLDLFAGSQLSEITFLDSQLGVVRWEKKVDCLGLITIILHKKLNSKIKLTWKSATDLNSLYGMSFLIVGTPNDLYLSSSFLTTFLQFGFTDLPKS